MNHDAPQPVGRAVPDWVAPPSPERRVLRGRRVAVAPLDADRDAAPLWGAIGRHERLWRYIPGAGPFADGAAFAAWTRVAAAGTDPMAHAIIPDRDGGAAGVASFMRITPAAGTIEIGGICLGPALQGAAAATEALSLMIGAAFALGYRRVEWKCDALNAPSRRAAQRLGFSFEGVFRQALVVKGHNRDTAWYAIIDGEWPPIAAAHAAWLADGNFDAAGRQRARLSDMTRPLLAAVG